MTGDLMEKLLCGIFDNVDLTTAITAGCEIETQYNSETEMFTIKTKYPVAFLKEHGRVTVYEHRGDSINQSGNSPQKNL